MNPRTSRSLLTGTLLATTLFSGIATADSPGYVGPYQVAHSTRVRADVWMTVQAVRDGEQEERQLECWIEDGIESEAAYCPVLDLTLPMEVRHSGEFASHVGFDLIELEEWAESRNLELEDVTTEFPPQRAEAYFDFWTMRWYCAVEIKDWVTCEEKCGGRLAEPPTAKPTVNNNNPYSEPSCDVTCECLSGDTIEYEDAPAVIPSPFAG